MTDINARIAKAKGYTPELCPCGCGVTGWRNKDGIFVYDDWAGDWSSAGELLEELLDNEQLIAIEHNTWHSGYTISQNDKDKFYPTLMRAIAEYWLEWKGE